VSAVVAYFPTTDLLLSGGRNPLETRILPPPMTAALLGLDRVDDDPELARSASPRHRVHAAAPPHLILHGDRDMVVNQEQSRVLHEALSAAGAQSTYVLIAGTGHAGPEFSASAITATVTGFLAEKLGLQGATTGLSRAAAHSEADTRSGASGAARLPEANAASGSAGHLRLSGRKAPPMIANPSLARNLTGATAGPLRRQQTGTPQLPPSGAALGATAGLRSCQSVLEPSGNCL
jgi:hypothetical protein